MRVPRLLARKPENFIYTALFRTEYTKCFTGRRKGKEGDIRDREGNITMRNKCIIHKIKKKPKKTDAFKDVH